MVMEMLMVMKITTFDTLEGAEVSLELMQT